MPDEIELGWLRLTDKSELVVTTLHVFQHAKRGIFGESQTILSRNAITTVRVRWHRSRWLVFLGTIFVLASVFLMISSIMGVPAGMPLVNRILNLPSSTLFSIQYGSLLGGIGLLLLFWLDKQTEIQIMSPTATIGGVARSYEEAQKFCSLFVSFMREQTATAKKAKTEATSNPKATDSD